MDLIDCSQENATKWFKYYVESKRFLQASVVEQINNVCLSMIGNSYSTSTYYIMYGCARTNAADGGSGAAAVSAGVIFYNGELFTVPAFSTSDIAGQNLYIAVSDTTPTTKSLIDIGGSISTTLNPVTASDGNSYELHHQRQIVVTQAGSGTTLFNSATNILSAGWTLLSLNSGWTNTNYPTDAKAAYIKDRSVVRLRGRVTYTNTSSGSDIALFTLPLGFRPAYELIFVVNATVGANSAFSLGSDLGQISIRVKANGDVTLISFVRTSGTASCDYSLDGISFRVD